MGLDILAASNLRYMRPKFSSFEFEAFEEELRKDDKVLYEVYFPLDDNANDEWDTYISDMKQGLYEYTADSKLLEFRVGSYGWYSEWRAELFRFAYGLDPKYDWPDFKQLPNQTFRELIYFTDCDGQIGTAISEKLSLDFKSHMLRAKSFNSLVGESFFDLYEQFAEAFEIASQKGALKFC